MTNVSKIEQDKIVKKLFDVLSSGRFAQWYSEEGRFGKWITDSEGNKEVLLDDIRNFLGFEQK